VNQNAFVNDDLPSALVTGKIRLREDIQTITDDSVLFVDGEKEENIDAIIYATGYNLDFPFLKGKSVILENNTSNLYKFVFPTDVHPPTLAVIGCVEPFGAIMPVSEIQSRWAARIVKGTAKLPSVAHMKDEVASRNAKIEKIYLSSMRHRIHYDWMTHMDDIAEEVGCKPDIFALLKTDPRLALAVFFGPCLPFHYRLTGPGSWSLARQTTLDVWDRLAAPMRTRKVVSGSWKTVAMIFKLLIVLIVILWFWVKLF